MNEKPLVSIIVSFYNEEKYIKDCIESILNSSYSNLELILVNDGSTDESQTIVSSFRDERIKVICYDANHGQAYGRNKGLDIAKGELIGFFDGDDVMAYDKIQIQVDYLRKHEDILLVAGYYDYIDTDGKVISKTNGEKIVFQDDNQVRAYMLFDNCVACGSSLFRRSIIDVFHIRNDESMRLSQDYRFWIDCLACGKIVIMDKIVYHYRFNYGSHSSKLFSGREQEYYKAMVNLAEYIWNLRGFNLTHEEIEYIYFHAKMVKGQYALSEYRYQKKLEEKIKEQCVSLGLPESKEILLIYRKKMFRTWSIGRICMRINLLIDKFF